MSIATPAQLASHRARIIAKLLAIESWPLKTHAHLAALLGVKKDFVVRLIHHAPELYPLWTKAKAERHGRGVITKLRAIESWPLKTHEQLAALLGVKKDFVVNLIYHTPDLHPLWTKAKAERHALNRSTQLHEYDFRKVKGWVNLPVEDIVRALKVNLSTFKKFRTRLPELNKAWQTRPRIGKSPSPELLRKIEQIKAIPGWETTPRVEIAHKLGISRIRLFQLIRKRKEMAALFRSHKGVPSKWTKERIEEVHSRCSSAEEAAKAMEVGVDTYRTRLRDMGITRRPSMYRLHRPTFARRLEKIPGWEELSVGVLAHRLGVSHSRVSELFALHPELRAQRKINQHGYPFAKKILALPNWQTATTEDIARHFGVPTYVIAGVFRCTPKLAATRSHPKFLPWESACQDIRSVKGWETKHAAQLARQLKRNPGHVAVAIYEHPELHRLWRPKFREEPLISAIQKVPRWKKLTHLELGHALGRRPLNVHRALLTLCHRPKSGIDPEKVRGLHSVTRI